MAEFAASTCLTLREIENELREVTGEDWYPLGVQLGLRPATLREIQRNYPLDTERCKGEMLDIWLRNAPKVSWKSLAQAVQGLDRYESLAEKLRRKLPQAPKEQLLSITTGTQERDASRYSVEEQSTPAVERKCTRDEDIMTQEPGLSDLSVKVTPPSEELWPSSYQYLHHGGVGGHQPTFTPPQLLQQGELSSISPGAHGRAASTESRQSVEEQSIPPVKHKCTREEDIMAAIPDINTMSKVPEHPDDWKMSPLYWAADEGHVHTVKCLIEKGAQVNSKDVTGAAASGHTDTVQCLIEKGADIMIKDGDGKTPLHQAAEGGHVDMVKFLVQMGANIHSRDDDGRTPLHLAAGGGHVDTVKSLVQKGANIHSKCNAGSTPLHWAAGGGHVDTVKFLVQKGANIHSKDNNGLTSLHWAARGGHVETVKFLIIQKGANIDSESIIESTPLHWAAGGGHVDTVKFLVQKGANIHSKDNNGNTPQDWAVQWSREAVVSYLKRATDPNMLEESESTGRQQEQRQSPEETDNSPSEEPPASSEGEEREESDHEAALRAALKCYTVKAKPTGIDLGSGTYGRVIELLSAGEIVAGKVFKTSSSIHQQTSKNKWFGELTLMAQVHHPTIAQCKGVCFLENETMPVLLMERLMSNLHAYLLKPANLNTALEKKLSILCDVANGLFYLHSHTPAIIHRDLTGNNVLLNSELRAKISDFGNARLMDLDPEATPGIFTSLPGTPDYMPPEAQGDSSKYGPSLDVFSFGHLSLFTINQSPVHPLLPSTYIDAKGEVHGRSEVKRREQYLDKAEQVLGGKHLVVVFIKKCLHNDPALRLLTAELETRLQDILSTEASPATASFTPQRPSTPPPIDIHGVENEDGITVLDEDDLHDVISAVTGLAGRWQHLGSSLRLRSGDLDAILSASTHCPSDSLRQVLTLWLKQSYNVKRFGKPTWRRLVEAVEDPVGGNNHALALKIAAEHPAVTSGN